MTIAVVIIAVAAVLLCIALGLIVRKTRRLPAREPLRQDAGDLAAPLPIAVAEDDAAPERVRERDTTPV